MSYETDRVQQLIWSITTETGWVES